MTAANTRFSSRGHSANGHLSSKLMIVLLISGHPMPIDAPIDILYAEAITNGHNKWILCTAMSQPQASVQMSDCQNPYFLDFAAGFSAAAGMLPLTCSVAVIPCATSCCQPLKEQTPGLVKKQWLC